MLILLYSDTNYVMDGFSASYFSSACPNNCSRHGECDGVTGVCSCQPGFSSPDCSLPQCPGRCGVSAGWGDCVSSANTTRCRCNPGFVGDDCSLNIKNYVGNTWSMVSRQGPGRLRPRTLHAAAYDETRDILYVHGGFDLNTLVLDNLIMYNFTSNTWLSAREYQDRLHVNHDDVVDDSILEEPDVSENVIDIEDENLEKKTLKEIKSDKRSKKKIKFTKINSTTVSMQMIPIDSVNSTLSDLVRKRRMIPENMFQTEREFPGEDSFHPRLKGHKMVLIESGLLIFGGKSSDDFLSNQLWHYNFTSGLWTVKADQSRVQPTPVWLHCAVVISDYLYVFGGSAAGGRFVSDIFRINTLSLSQWEEVAVKAGKTLDVRLTGHSCVEFSQSLLVFGGLTTDMARFSKLSRKLYQFDTVESVWSEIKYPDTKAAPPELAFHTSVIIGHYMVVFGGYVHTHSRYEKCYENSLFFFNLNCYSWQSVENEHNPPRYNYPRHQGMFGHTAVVRKRSQLILAGGYQGSVTGDVLGYTVPSTLASLTVPCHLYGKQTACTSNPSCGWCGRTGQCLGRSEGERCPTALLTSACPGRCSSLTSCLSCSSQARAGCVWCVSRGECQADTSQDCPQLSSQLSWWDPVSSITSPALCASHDLRPGLTVSRLYNLNSSFPYSVSISNTSDILLSNQDKLGRQKDISVSLKGTIHPAYDESKPVRHLQTCLANGEGSLYLSVSPPLSAVQKILNISHVSSSIFKRSCETPKWLDGRLVYLFPQNAFHLKYQLRLHLLEQPRGFQETRVSLQEMETGKLFDWNHLEPWRAGDCESLLHCKQCIEDQLCGWCRHTRSCHLRSNSSQNSSLCPAYLITESEQCEDCADQISCHDCLTDPACAWLTTEVSCVRAGLFPPGEVTSQLSSCPSPCSDRTSCSSCLSQPGRCVWCHSQSSCLQFSVYTSEFQFGGCQHWSDLSSPGQEVEEKCDSCSHFSSCSDCLSRLGCGWCNGTCSSRASCPPHQQWRYFSCPDIDECSLGLDNCHPRASCLNTARAFQCSCMAGYEGDGVSCSKTCEPPCGEHGQCSGAPHFQCHCQLGWTGETCDTDCGCHQLSSCQAGPGLCDRCTANTAGPDCGRCAEGFVRDSSGACVSCRVFCHGHTRSCLSHSGSSDQVCLHCQNGTTGARCEQCLPGTFRTSSSLRDRCSPCYCNGHGDPQTCHPLTGLGCSCHNHTVTDLNTNTGCSTEECWKHQCARCEQYFLGDPRHGHHCYRAMMVNSDYCLDDEHSLPFQPDFCALHTPIIPGQVAFFAVQPKFMNVHIRVNVDMMEGEVDVILTSNSQLFIVESNQSSFLHNIRLDEQQFDLHLNPGEPEGSQPPLTGYPSIARLLSHSRGSFRSRRTKERVFSLRVSRAEGLSTFVSLHNPQEVLLVRNVQNRLIISIPELDHDLRSSKFYLLIYGSEAGKSDKIIGNIFFRQDQLHIDLFVFFSVFFSCFFLFLSFCVVAWKFKISVDTRSARRRQVAEMTIMAQRPFASQFVMIDRSEDPNTSRLFCSSSPATARKKGKKLWLGRQIIASEHPASSVHELLLPQQSSETFGVTAISVETTSDAKAAVTSLLVQMPGHQRRLQVGSVLTTAAAATAAINK